MATTPNRYDIGSVVNLTVTFTDINGNPVDPSDCQLLLKLPDNTEQTIPMVDLAHTGQGKFAYAFTTTMVGLHYYRYESSGFFIAVADGAFQVGASPFLPC